MYLKLRILFTVLSAICIAIAIPVGVTAGLTGVLICAGLAFAFYLVMLFFKGKQEALNPPQCTEQSEGNEGLEDKNSEPAEE